LFLLAIMTREQTKRNEQPFKSELSSPAQGDADDGGDSSARRIFNEEEESVYATERRQEMLRERIEKQDLPVKREFNALVNTLTRVCQDGGGLLLLQGETGSGKSIYSPLALRRALQKLNLPDSIIVMQPRRDAASGVARAVAAVSGETLGAGVGFSTSESKTLGPKTAIKIVTSGIFLRYLQEGRCDKGAVGALMLDEIHEGSLEYHFALGLLKMMRQKGRAPLTLLTSATLNKERVQEFFGIDDDAYLRIEGRAYPVETSYLALAEAQSDAPDRKNYIAQVADKVREVCASGEEGDMLVFMPGAAEIRDVINRLKGTVANAEIVPLYGGLGPEDRDKALSADPLMDTPSGRRIIVATNIAETSVTVPGISIVVDSCRQRSIRYNPASGIIERGTEFISKDQAEQRAGRAGRISRGTCYRMVSERAFESLSPHPDSEIKRTSLSKLVLDLKGLGIDPEQFPYIEMPDMQAIRRGINELTQLGALDDKEALTDIGREMKIFPFEPSIGRMLVEAKRRKCFLPALVLAILEREGNVLLGPSQADIEKAAGYDEREKRRNARVALQRLHQRFSESNSDLLQGLAIFREALDNGVIEAMRRDNTPEGRQARTMFREWCHKNYVREEGLAHIAYRAQEFAREAGARLNYQDLKEQLRDIEHNRDLSAVILSGHPGKILYRAASGRGLAVYKKLGDPQGTSFNLAPESAAFRAEPLLCVTEADPHQGSGTHRGQDITRVYASRIHPIAPQELFAMFPQFISETEVAVSYNPETDRVQSAIKFFLKGENIQLAEEKRDTQGERAAAAFAEALAGGRVDMPCAMHNREVLARINELSIRCGGKGPQGPHMATWYKEHLGTAASRAQALLIHAELELSLEDFYPRQREQEIEEACPKTITIKGVSYPVEYSYRAPNAQYNLQEEYKATITLSPEYLFTIDAGDLPAIGIPPHHPLVLLRVHAGGSIIQEPDIERVKDRFDAYAIQNAWIMWSQKPQREPIEVSALSPLTLLLEESGKKPLAYTRDRFGREVLAYPAFRYAEEAIQGAISRQARYYIEYFADEEAARKAQEQSEAKKIEYDQKEQRRLDREALLAPAFELLNEVESLTSRLSNDALLCREYGMTSDTAYKVRNYEVPKMRDLLKDRYNATKPDADPKQALELLQEFKERVEKRRTQIEERIKLVPDILELRDRVGVLVDEKLSSYTYSEYGFMEAERQRLLETWARANQLLQVEDSAGEPALPNPKEAEQLLKNLEASLLYARKAGEETVGAGLLGDALKKAQEEKTQKDISLHQEIPEESAARVFADAPPVRQAAEENQEEVMTEEVKTGFLAEINSLRDILDGVRHLGQRPKSATTTRDKNLSTLYTRVGEIKRDIPALTHDIGHGNVSVASARGKIQGLKDKIRSAYKRAVGIIPEYQNEWVDVYANLWQGIPLAVDANPDAQEFIQSGLVKRDEIINKARNNLIDAIPLLQTQPSLPDLKEAIERGLSTT